MNKIIRRLKRRESDTYFLPQKVQDIIPIKTVWEDGIFEVGRKFSRSTLR